MTLDRAGLHTTNLSETGLTAGLFKLNSRSSCLSRRPRRYVPTNSLPPYLHVYTTTFHDVNFHPLQIIYSKKEKDPPPLCIIKYNKRTVMTKNNCTGVGVGDASASATSALLLSILQESMGRVATILFAHRLGMALEPECKMYRLLVCSFYQHVNCWQNKC
jgi:hypothetical protein